MRPSRPEPTDFELTHTQTIDEALSRLGAPITEAEARRIPSPEECECRDGMFALAATRRQVFAGTGLAAAASIGAVFPAAAKAPAGAVEYPVPADSTKEQGRVMGADAGYGTRSQFETELRWANPTKTAGFSPLQNSFGTITPSGLHAPLPGGSGGLHKVCGWPPVTSIFLSSFPAEKPRNLLSGDQKGDLPFSVPGSFRHSRVSRSWIHKPPCAPVALKTSLWPSGDTETYRLNSTPSGSATWKRVVRPGAAGLDRSHHTAPATTMSNTAIAGHNL